MTAVPGRGGGGGGSAGWVLLAAGLRGSGRAWAGLVAFSAVEALPALLTARLVASALDDGFLAGRPIVGLARLGALLGLALLAALATREVVGYLGKIVEPVRDHLVRHVVDAALRRAVAETGPGHGSGDAAAVSRLTDQVESVRLTGSALLRTSRQVTVSLVAGVAGLALLSPVLLVVVVPPLAIALALFGQLLRPLARRQRTAVLAEEAIASESAGTLFGLRDVLGCQAAFRAAAALDRRIDHQLDTTRALGRASVGRILIISLGSELPLVALLIAGPFLVGSGRLTTGELIGAASYLLISLAPALGSLVQVVGSYALQLTVVTARLAEVGAGPASPPVATPARPRPHPAPPPGSELSVRGLTFSYGPHSAPVLRDLDLDVADGEHLAVVGPSGAGKSTLTQLICGLVAPQRGTVWLDGVPIDRMRPADRHAAVTLVPQQAYLFLGTLEENLRYLNPTADAEAVRRSVRAVGLEPLVDELGGYRAVLFPQELSAGHRQLVALARAHLSAARVCILDEASCHLDAATERRAERAFRARGGTLIVVAHRISSAARADRVLLLDGERARTGTHAELVRTQPSYAALVGHWAGADPSPERPVPAEHGGVDGGLALAPGPETAPAGRR